MWVETVAQLAAAVDLTEADVPAVEQMVQQIVTARDARRRIDVDGLVVLGAKDEPVPHPALAIERAAQTEIRRWHERLVTPAATMAKARKGGSLS